MSTTLHYLERLQAANNGASDYQAAKLLGIRPSAISNWRHRGSHMSEETALKVAELLGVSPLQVLAELHAEQAKSEAVRTVWRELSNRHRLMNGNGNKSAH